MTNSQLRKQTIITLIQLKKIVILVQVMNNFIYGKKKK
jgi:hypothetical protein